MNKASLTAALSLAALVLLESVSFVANGISGARGLLILTHLLPYAAVFGIASLFFSCFPAAFERTAAFALSLWLSCESILGMMQLAGFRMSSHRLFRLTGNFDNPGPYGGFLAVCVAVCLASALKFRCSDAKPDKALSCLCVISSILGFVVLPASMSRTAWAALAAAALTFLLNRGGIMLLAKRHKCLSVTLIVVCVLLGGAAFFLKKDSAVGRMHIWRMEVRSLAAHPLAGYGPGSALGAYAEAQADYFAACERSETEIHTAGCPEYPFNEYLRFGLEAGLGALVLSAVLAASAIAALMKASSPFAFGLVALTVFGFASYPLSVPQLALLLSVFLACAVASGSSRGRRTGLRTALNSAAAVAFVAVLVFGLHRGKQISAAHRKCAEAKAVAEELPPGTLLRILSSQYGLLCDDRMYLYDYGYSLYLAGEYERGVEVLREGAAISCDPMFLNIAGRCLEGLGDYEAAKRSYIRSSQTVPARLYPLVLLMNLHLRLGDVGSAVYCAEKILSKPYNPDNWNMLQMRSRAQAVLEKEDSYE